MFACFFGYNKEQKVRIAEKILQREKAAQEIEKEEIERTELALLAQKNKISNSSI